VTFSTTFVAKTGAFEAFSRASSAFEAEIRVQIGRFSAVARSGDAAD